MISDTTDTQTRALVLANGAPPAREVFDRLAEVSGAFFCVDGGANWAAREGVVPVAAFGDFDSVLETTRTVFQEVPFILTQNQEFTDLEKALGEVIQRGYNSISLLGAVGDRVDHSLALPGALLRYRQQAAITCHTDTEDFFLLSQSIRLSTAEGQRVSILPVFGPAFVKTRGLRYPLNDEKLQMGIRDGVSNSAMGSVAQISVRENPVLVVIERQSLSQFNFAPRVAASTLQ